MGLRALQRVETTGFANLDLKSVTAEGRFSGYASLFDEVDLGKDAIERGAFARSLQQRGVAGVRMLFQHDPAEPLGSWQTIREDGRGLYVEGLLAPGVAKAREVHQLMRSGALDGLSIGFQTVKARTDAKSGVRRILEADLWEISVVTFPMLLSARVDTVKRLGSCPTKRQFERWLTRDAGLTRSEAKALLARGFDAMTGLRDADGETDLAALATRMRAAVRLIKTSS